MITRLFVAVCMIVLRRGIEGRIKKSYKTLVLCKLPYDLFRKMQIQQSTSPCLPKGPADSQSEKEGGRRREGWGGGDPNCKSQPAEQTPAAKPVGSLRIRKPRVSDNFPLVSQHQMPSNLFWLSPKLYTVQALFE